MTRNVSVRPATTDDLPGVLGVLDAAALETDADQTRERIEHDDVFVAVRDTSDGETAEAAASESDSGRQPILGAVVLVEPEAGTAASNTAHIDVVGVRRRRRGQGIGGALVQAAAKEYDRLTAAFDQGVRPFYESLGFTVEPAESEGTDRYRGDLETTEPQL